MKFTTGLALLAASLVSATPMGLLEDRDAIIKRQSSATCTIGYCAYGGTTTGGSGGATVTVSTVAQLESAAARTDKVIILVSGAISGSAKIRVAADKTIYGQPGSSLTGVGLYIRRVSNVIVRNMKISKVDASNGDAIGIDASTRVWIDHCDLSGDLSLGKDDLDGLLDISHGADYITVSYNYLHDHWKGSLIGHSDNNESEDKGKLRITYANNHFKNVFSRTPLIRFAQVHIVNGFYEGLIDSGINTRMGAQVLVQSTAFRNSASRAIFFADSDYTGYAVAQDVDLGGSVNSAPVGTFTSAPYSITRLGSAAVPGTVPGQAGQRL